MLNHPRSLQEATASTSIEATPSINRELGYIEGSIAGLEGGVSELTEALKQVSLVPVSPTGPGGTDSPKPIVSDMEGRLQRILSRIFQLREAITELRRNLRID